MSKFADSINGLPMIIATYLAAANEGRDDSASACFTENARVQDENHDHVGHTAIRQWVSEATAKYHPKTEILHVTENEGTYLVSTRVSGSFPGSPVELDFSFTLADEKISNLSIQ
jgi:SnoaL-like domain